MKNKLNSEFRKLIRQLQTIHRAHIKYERKHYPKEVKKQVYALLDTIETKGLVAKCEDTLFASLLVEANEITNLIDLKK